MSKYKALAACAIITSLATPALAYVGPGAGITMLGALWAVIVAVVLAFGAVLFWPFRMLLRKWRKKPAGAAAEPELSPADSGKAERTEAGN